MARKLLERGDTLPRIVRDIYDLLLVNDDVFQPWCIDFDDYTGERIEPGLGLVLPNMYEGDQVGGDTYYYFEGNPEDPQFHYEVVAVYSRDSASVKRLEFHLYGENGDARLVVSVKPLLPFFTGKEDDPEWLAWVDVDSHPMYVAVKSGGEELFRWTYGVSKEEQLKKLLGVERCETREILSRFTAVGNKTVIEYRPATGEKKEMQAEATILDYKLLGEILKQAEEKFSKSWLFKAGKVQQAGSDEEETSLGAYPEVLRKYAKMVNDDTYEIDSNVLENVMHELITWCRCREKAAKYDCDSAEFEALLFRTNLPNLAFLGEPGTGKTELARRIATKILDAEFVEITGGGMKGPYIGWTNVLILQKFKEMRERAESNIKPTILFIDEAYNLFGTDDKFGNDAVEFLLKAMERGKRTLTATDLNHGNNDAGREITFTLDENTAVWLGGYEKEMRKALSANQGMYRRVKTIVLPSPDENALWEIFMNTMSRGTALLDEDAWEQNIAFCKGAGKPYIMEYFRWGRSKTYAEFFGNYAGVKRFAEEIEKISLLKNGAISEVDLVNAVNRQKNEILTQYRQVIEEKYDRLPFEVQTEVEKTFKKDYKGSKAITEKLKQIITMLSDRKKYPGCDVPKGALLVGPPGTGKTLLAECLAGELKQRAASKDIAFISVAATEIKSAELVRALFSEAKAYDSAVIFIDEIDAIGKKRELLIDPSVLIQLMSEMDGFDSSKTENSLDSGKNIFILAATNAPEILDDALTRPGRFDISIEVGYPSDEVREDLVRSCLGFSCSHKEKLVKDIARKCRGCSPVEIKTVINDAKILYYDCESKLRSAETLEVWFAHRICKEEDEKDTGLEVITLKDGESVVVSGSVEGAANERKGSPNEKLFLRDFEEVLAQRRIGMRSTLPKDGDKPFSAKENDAGLASTAIHEAGHALVSVLHGRKIERITILQRGDVLGYVESDAATSIRTKEEYLTQLDVSFGGRAAEELIYGADRISSGASSDILKASRIARSMVMQLGMNEKVGPMALETPAGRYLGGRNLVLGSGSSIDMAEDEIRKLLKERYAAALEMLRPYTSGIEEIARFVYEKEEATGAELAEEVRSHPEIYGEELAGFFDHIEW